MSRASNSLKATDVTATPIKLKYSASYSDTTICDSGIYAQTGINGPVTITGSIPEATLRYWSIRHLYYSNFLTGSYQVSGSSADNFLQSTAASGTFEGNTVASASADIRSFPTASGAKIKIINIPRSSFGEQVSRKSFFLTSDDGTSYQLVDDGNGNIIDVLSSNEHVGNIIYAQGFVIITNSNYYCAMDGGPTTFPKSYVFDITTSPKTFTPIAGAIPDCAPIVSSSLALQEYPYYSFPSNSISNVGAVTLSESDPLTNKIGTYKSLYTLESTYCATSDEQVIDVQIVDCTVRGLTVTEINPSPSPTQTPTQTPTPTVTQTPTPTITPTVSITPSTTATIGASSTPSASVSKTPSLTPTISTTASPSISVTPSMSASPGATLVQVDWITGPKGAGAGELIIRNLAGTVALDEITTPSQKSGTIYISTSLVPFSVTGSWSAGSGNIIRYRVCDIYNGGELFYSGDIDNIVGSVSYLASPTSLQTQVWLTSGASNTPPLCDVSITVTNPGVFPYPVTAGNGSASGTITNTIGATVYVYLVFNSGGNSSGNIGSDSGVVDGTSIPMSGTVTSSGQTIYSATYATITNGSTGLSWSLSKQDTLSSGASLRLGYSTTPGGSITLLAP